MDGPTVIIGNRRYIEWLRAYLDDQRQKQIEQAFHTEAPTHFVRTVHDQIGMGHSYAEAFHDLVRRS